MSPPKIIKKNPSDQLEFDKRLQAMEGERKPATTAEIAQMLGLLDDNMA